MVEEAVYGLVIMETLVPAVLVSLYFVIRLELYKLVMQRQLVVLLVSIIITLFMPLPVLEHSQIPLVQTLLE